jgi:hypothetical protein
MPVRTERLQKLLDELESKRTKLNTSTIDYIKRNIEAKGWTEKQVVARSRQSRDSNEYQAKFGKPEYRELHQADAEIFSFAIDFLG